MTPAALAYAWAATTEERALIDVGPVTFTSPEHDGDHLWRLTVGDEDADGWGRLIWCPTADRDEAMWAAMRQAPLTTEGIVRVVEPPRS